MRARSVWNSRSAGTPQRKDAREHGYEVIRVTHRERAGAAATEMRRYGNKTELSLPIRFMNTSPRSSLRVTLRMLSTLMRFSVPEFCQATWRVRKASRYEYVTREGIAMLSKKYSRTTHRTARKDDALSSYAHEGFLTWSDFPHLAMQSQALDLGKQSYVT